MRTIDIKVVTRYLGQQPSMIDEDIKEYAFSYTITISNHSDDTVQLISRHWIITDGNNHVEEVRGPGVVGKTPILEPGESFTYTSGALVKTPAGSSMKGSYQFIDSR
ncbi:MAG: Co2+/Mg2+ efflux protein ApaG, partial [Pseudomonadales bacterium]|nr:Co2+/Mg2+ efflux protein ApaG [Pseudomonadales bacterium]